MRYPKDTLKNIHLHKSLYPLYDARNKLMNNLFKVILLCAILSNTFTPCFSEEHLPQNQAVGTLANLPPAVPAELVQPKLEISEQVAEKPLTNLPNAQSNVTSIQNGDSFAVSNTDISNLVKPEPTASELVGENQASEVDFPQKTALAGCPINPLLGVNAEQTVEGFKTAYKCLADKELTAIKLEKGRKFEVKSVHPMSYKSASGTEVWFESVFPERIFLSKEPAKLIFKGEVIKNNPPRKGGSSGTLKVQITGITVDTVTYPAEAYISKMNNKGLKFGAVAGSSAYLANLARTANNGTINQHYHVDPCDRLQNECVNAVAKPFYFLTGAALHTADLLLAPLIAFLAVGEELYIPEGTEFEIKLEEDVPVLEL